MSVHHGPGSRVVLRDDLEAARLREYLLKGGFLWVDDFWGEYAWQVWESQISKVLPPAEFPNLICEESSRCSAPCWTCRKSCRRCRRSISGAAVAAAHPNVMRTVRASTPRGIFDKQGRLMVSPVAQHRHLRLMGARGHEHGVLVESRFEGYALAVNVILYAMTH